MAEERLGVVKAINETGILLVGDRKWLDFSLEDYREPPWDDAREGDEVRLMLSYSKKREKDYIQSIEVIGEDAVPSHDAEPAFPEDDEPPDSPQPRPGPRGGTLTREKALEAAARLCVNRLATHDTTFVSKEVLDLAGEFEAWILRGSD
ncbi:hypothetical protein LCGC14_2983700 [marine sediment metagenome]|uniref:Uncharacterized protein n=1 Tax=marine sediment metagenome TaxID=412755 RepID=A0A0F8ZWZ7_9ZZZZ